MTLLSALRHVLLCAGVAGVLASAAATARAAPGRAAAQGAPVHGLIVQLREAPSHASLARARAQGRAGDAPGHEAARWNRLVSDLRNDSAVLRELPDWGPAPPRRDPVGTSAQLLRFARPLTAAQAERIAARLAARPDVAWVTTNSRERRQATALNAPNDPYFAGTSGQWWLHPLQGSNDSPIEGRLRGVPSFLPAWLNSSSGSAAAVVAVLDSGITCHPDLGNDTPGCIGGSILPGYDFVSDWDPVAQRGYANDGDGRDTDPRDPGDWVDVADRSADPSRYDTCELEDSSWHGTIIAGIVAAQTDNGAGVAGANWNGRVVPVRVAGKCGATVADIVDGMRWAAGLSVCKVSDGAGGCTEFAPPNPNPARIINISFGGSAVCGAMYQQAIDELRGVVFPGGAVGAVVVAAAGNGWGTPLRPASCERVIGVGALNRDGFKTTYSNFGAQLAISTVGGDDNDGAWSSLLADSGILSVSNCGRHGPETDCTQPNANTLAQVNWYYNHFGTSFSAPIVAGAVSLMLSVNPALSAVEIGQGLARSARPHVTTTVAGFGACSDSNPGRCVCTTSTCGAGILDAAQALYFAANPSGYVNTRGADVIDTAELRAAVALGPDRAANPTPPPASSGSGGGGGAMSAAWLLALAAAGAALAAPFSARASLTAAARTLRSRRRARRH
jgi:serine protease